LHGSGRSVKLLLEFLQGSKVAGDGVLERAWFEDTTIAATLFATGSEILPEERVIDVTCESDKAPYISECWKMTDRHR
jgi:hypothetical protein